jgi:type IV pilus assembly protein PilA
MRLRHHKRAAFTLVEIMIVVVIIGLISGIAVPYYVRARENSQRASCLNNLAQIDSAKQQWGVEKGKSNGDMPADTDLFGLEAYLKAKPVCPTGGEYTVNPIGTNATCSITSHVVN